MISVGSFFRNLALFVLLVTAAGPRATAAEGLLEDAIRLYDAGRYAESKPLLAQVVATGNADGATHYRLYFCQRSTNDPAQRQTLEQARTLLEKEVAGAQGFESAFYLSNTYSNLGLTEEVSRNATEVTGRFEVGALEAPTSAVEQFRLGKLYADLNKDRSASPWFEKCVDGFAASAVPAHRPYLEWAARWLGNRAIDEERFEAAAKQLTHLSDGPNATLEEIDKLGLASLMIGDYRAATKAWQRAIRINPGNADRYRYGSGLAELCRQTEEIPISPDGERGWNELSGEELEQILSRQAERVREIKAEAEGIERLTRAQRLSFDAELDEARPLFAGAALESMRRGINLREAAFFGGYAPLIFRVREWRVKAAPVEKVLRVRDVAGPKPERPEAGDEDD